MPILRITVVGRRDERNLRADTAALAEAAGEIFQSPPGGTWVTLELLPRAHYAENGAGPPDGVRPVFIRVILADSGTAAEKAAWARALADACASIMNRPTENIHILFEPSAGGRIAFGGVLSTD